MTLARPLLCCMLLWLSACAPDNLRCAPLGQGSYCLQPTTAMAPFEVQQKIDVSLQGQSNTLIAQLEVDAAGLRLGGVTPLGQKLVDVQYDNHTVSSTTLPHPRLSPTLLLTLLQLALWPTPAVRAGLAEPLLLEDSALERRIVNGTQTVVSITYDNAVQPHQRIHMTLHGAKLELNIETLAIVSDDEGKK